MDIKEQLLANRHADELTGCWVWTGTVAPYNYGTISINGRSKMVHRLAYTEWVGAIPKGQFVMHKCDNPRCFNPDHLRTGTPRENNLDCVAKGRHANASKTHCKRGHEFSIENTKLYRGGRSCMACSRLRETAPVKTPRSLNRCKRGHDYTPENTYQEPNGGRKCRICQRARLSGRRKAVISLMKENKGDISYRTQ